MKNQRLLGLLLSSVVVTGCATLDGILENLGLKNTEKVEQVQITAINEEYVFIKSANVRAAPNTSAMILGTLKAGQRFFALGRTADDWIAISDKTGKRLGYVHASLVQKAGKQVTTAKKRSSAKKPTATSSAKVEDTETTTTSQDRTTGVNLDSIPTNSNQSGATLGVNLDEL